MNAAASNNPPTAYREERLYILHMLEDLALRLERSSEAAAVFRAKIEEKAERDANKAAKDLRSAHDKIRALETTGVTMGVKNWVMTVALSICGAIAFEIVKEWMAKR